MEITIEVRLSGKFLCHQTFESWSEVVTYCIGLDPKLTARIINVETAKEVQ